MRELDVLLTAYLEDQYPHADAAEKAAFQRLLALSDPELRSYLLGGMTPADAEIANVVASLRSSAPT